jgi:hypothetical protein
MWMADESGVRGVFTSGIQNGFKSACRAMEVVNGPKMRDERVSHPIQFIVL